MPDITPEILNIALWFIAIVVAAYQGIRAGRYRDVLDTIVDAIENAPPELANEAKREVNDNARRNANQDVVYVVVQQSLMRNKLKKPPKAAP